MRREVRDGATAWVPVVSAVGRMLLQGLGIEKRMGFVVVWWCVPCW